MTILVSVIFHPKVGKEAELLKALKDKVAPAAYQNKASMVGIYHKKHTDVIVIATHHPSENFAAAYLKTDFKTLNPLCSTPFTTEMFEILSEEAA